MSFPERKCPFRRVYVQPSEESFFVFGCLLEPALAHFSYLVTGAVSSHPHHDPALVRAGIRCGLVPHDQYVSGLRFTSH